MHFGSPAGARRLQKAALATPEVPQDSAKRPKGQPLGDQRAPKETPGWPKYRQSSSKGRFSKHFGAENDVKTNFSVAQIALEADFGRQEHSRPILARFWMDFSQN